MRKIKEKIEINRILEIASTSVMFVIDPVFEIEKKQNKCHKKYY